MSTEFWKKLGTRLTKQSLYMLPFFNEVIKFYRHENERCWVQRAKEPFFCSILRVPKILPSILRATEFLSSDSFDSSFNEIYI